MPWIEGDGLTPTNLNNKFPSGLAFSVTDAAYGAVGDGVTDDTTAILAAAAAAQAVGGTLIIPATGNFYVFNGTLIPTKSMTIMGGGGANSTKPTELRRTSGTQSMLSITGSTGTYLQHVVVKDLYLNGNDGSGDLVECRYISNCFFERVFTGHTVGRAWRLRATQDCRWLHCEIDTCGSTAGTLAAVSIEDDSTASFNCNQLHFVGSRWETNQYAHAKIVGETGTTKSAIDIWFVNCKMESNQALTAAVIQSWTLNVCFVDTVVTITSSAPSGPTCLFSLTHAEETSFTNIWAQANTSTGDVIQLTTSTGVSLSRVFVSGTFTGGIVALQDTTSNAYLAGHVGAQTGTSSPPSQVTFGGGSTLSQIFYGAIDSGSLSARNPANTYYFGSGTGQPAYILDGAAGVTRDFRIASAGVRRWDIRTNATAESGSDAGSDFQIIAYDDSGNALGNGLTITRANLRAQFDGIVRVPSGTALLPSLAHSSEASLGLYRSAASHMALSYGTLTVPVVTANRATIPILDGNLAVAPSSGQTQIAADASGVTLGSAAAVNLYVFGGSGVTTRTAQGAICLHNASGSPDPADSTPAAGGVLFCRGGALLFKGGSGSLTTVALP